MTLRSRRAARTFVEVLSGLILSFLLVVPPALSQLRSLDVSQYLHTSWTAQDGYFRGIGISNNGIAQTADGYLWFLSPTGVFRFDGERFDEWKPPDGQAFPGHPPSQLLASSDGSLWIGGAGVAQLRKDGTWHRYHELDHLHRVRLAEDKNGVIWVGSESPAANSFALYYLDHGGFRAYQLPAFRGLTLVPLFADQQGRLWAGSNKGIWQILPGPPKLVLNRNLALPAFSEDSTGKLLYVDAGRVRALSPRETAKDYLGKLQIPNLNIRAMMRDTDGGLWIGTFGQGIVHVHEGHVDRYSSGDGLSSDVVESIFQDHEGNVWVASPESIDKFTKPAVPRLTRKQGLSGESVYSVLLDRRGTTWIGTSDGFNELVADHVIRPDGQPRNDGGLAMIETRDGHTILTTQGRGKVTAGSRGALIPGPDGGSWLAGYNNVFSLAEDNDGTLWAVSQQLGLLHLRQDGSLITAINDPKWGDYVLSLIFDRKRNGLWFTTHNGKVFFLKNGKTLEKYGSADGLPDGPVRIDSIDDDGGVWLSEAYGLAYLRNHKVSVLGVKNGMPCDGVHWMRHDQNQQAWIYTTCGLVSLSNDDLTAWTIKPSHKVSITHYLDNTEGVENDAIGGWYTPLVQMARDGRIWFAMRTGLGVLDPRHLNENMLPPPVNIERLTVDNREMEMGASVSIPAKPGSLHIAYTALSFAAPRKVRYRYKLVGYDKDWSLPVSLREASYTNLPPGDYGFRVIACNNDGVWNNVGATLNFVVLPAWYQTLWFRVIAALAVLSFLTALYLIRIRFMERQMHLRFSDRMAERMRISRELHDTLLQALQGLVLSFSNYTTQVSASPEVRKEMDRSLDRADRLMISGRDRIRYLRGEVHDINGLAIEIQSIIDDLFAEAPSKVTLSVEGSMKPLNAVIQDEILYIVKEALTNASRHSGADAIQCQISVEKSDLRISIRDNGRGAGPETLLVRREGHFGIVGMRERTKAIGGRFAISSKPGEGTVVDLYVPTRIAYNEKRSWIRNLILFGSPKP